MYGIPKSTLQDHVSGRIAIGSKSGPEPYLTPAEEEDLVRFIERCSAIGYSKTKSQIIDLVQKVMNNKKRDVSVSLGWYTSFRKRHPQLSIRVSESVSHVRAIGTREEVLSKYFDLLEQTLVDNDIIEKPNCIFNMDETGFSLDPCLPKVISAKGCKHPVSITTGNKSQITVVSACNAAGYVIPPMIILDRQTLKPEFTKGEVPGTIYGTSKKGWTDSDLFNLWFNNHFIAYAPPIRPLILLLDGHASHFHHLTIEKAAREQILIFCLPPHSSHKTQPLDKGCFSALKNFWRQECHNFLTKNPGRVITRNEFSQLFSLAWFKGMTMTNVISGFRTTGIYPFNRGALLPEEVENADLCKETGLKFIPLLTPSRRKSIRELNTVESPLLDGDNLSFLNDPVISPDPIVTPVSAMSPIPSFTDEEIALFEKRIREGYDVDLASDHRYKLWKSLNVQTTSTHTLDYSTVLSKTIENIAPNLKFPETAPKNSGRVLTSLENRSNLKEKERLKREKEAIKEERRKQREINAAEKLLKKSNIHV
jgi:hypothetical protein